MQRRSFLSAFLAAPLANALAPPAPIQHLDPKQHWQAQGWDLADWHGHRWRQGWDLADWHGHRWRSLSVTLEIDTPAKGLVLVRDEDRGVVIGGGEISPGHKHWVFPIDSTARTLSARVHCGNEPFKVWLVDISRAPA